MLQQGVPQADLTDLLGQHPATLGRRLTRLLRRIRQPGFIQLIRGEADIPTGTLEVARAYFLLGMPQRRVAKMLGISLHRTRQHLAVYQGFCDAKSADRR